MFRHSRGPVLAVLLLTAGLAIPAANAQEPLFNDPPPKEGGWKGLARLLEAISPGADTAIPLTPSEITSRISAMLDQGRNQEALDVILKREAQRQAEGAMGADVQLLFLKGRALGALDRHDEAIDVYRDMTVRYPELPEPWNNLAAEYIKQGKLDLARDALSMALTADPNYGVARANLGEVELMLAKRSFTDAAQLGVRAAGAKAAKTQAILDE